MVSLVRGLEVIGNTGCQLECGSVAELTAVAVIVAAPHSVRRVVVTSLCTVCLVGMSHVEHNSGLHAQSPSLLLTQVEIEVNTELAHSSVTVGLTVVLRVGRIEIVQITDTCLQTNLKQTGLTLVTAEPVHQVDLTHQGSCKVVHN